MSTNIGPKITEYMIPQAWLSTIMKEGWALVRTLINKAIKRSKPFVDVIEQCWVILQLPELQSGYYDIQVTLSEKQAIEIGKEGVVNTVYEGIIRLG